MASAAGMDLPVQYHHSLHQQTKPHQPNHSSQRPKLSYREPSQESSPPPSPDLFPQQGNAVKNSSTTLHTLLSPETSSSMNAGSSRRGATPPSPPISVHIEEPGSSPIRPSTPVAQQSMESKHTQFVEPTPPQSLKDKITRVFRGRAFSDASLSIRRHKKDNSNSTNATAITPQGVHPSSRSSVQQLDEQYGRQPTFYDSGAGIVSRSRANSHSQLLHGMAPPRRTIMNGGEVRVEIRPWPEQEDMQSKQQQQQQEDSSAKYYEYYTRSNSPDVNSIDDGGLKVENAKDFMSCPSLKSAISAEDLKAVSSTQRQSLERNQTYQTTSSDSQERKVAERVAETMEFEEFHIGITDGQSAKVPREAGGALISLQRNEFSNSGQASSDALGGIDSSLNRSHSSLARYGSRSGRPGFSRNLSTSSVGPPLAQSSRSNSALGSVSSGSDVVARELKRLSKISAGSGVSGMAIHVTVDGAGSTHVPEESEDEGDHITQRKYTREEKGKDRATSSVPSAVHDQHSSRQDLYNTSSEPQDRSSSPVSSTSRDKTELSTEDDSASLLPGTGEVTQTRKLRAQVPSKGVVVHQADGRFEHTYRMRTLPTEKSILVPQYRYPSAFPHRNALVAPVLVTDPSPQESGMPSSPAPAHVRTASIPQADGMFDENSPSQSLNNLIQPVRPSMDSHLTLPDPSRHGPNRSSWSPSRYLPSRPNKFLRRSLTPHLYSAAEAALLDDPQVDRPRERKIGRFLMFACLAFPPLLFVMAAGAMDVFVASWTRGAVKRVGRTEKRIALVLGTGILLAAVIGGVVGVSLAATA